MSHLLTTDLLMRSATFEPATYNAESGTVGVTFSTGADVQRRDHLGPFLERLSMIASDWELSGFAGAPVLDNHDRLSGVRSILGVVEQPAISGGLGTAVVRFGTRPEVKGIAADVGAGIIRQTSIGYTVREWTDSTENGVRIRTGRGVKPVELSFTALGADPGAHTRSLALGGSMDHSQIRSLAVGLGVPPKFADTLIQRDLPDDQVRREMVVEASRRLPQIDNRRPAEVSPVTEPDAMVRAMCDALYHRVNPSHPVSDLGRQFEGRRIADYARALLQARGVSTLGSDAEVITRMHSTGDFSDLLGTFAGKVLAASYQSAPSGLKTVCRRGAPHNDFKGRNVLRRGELPTLDTVPEGAEITHGTITEGKNSYSVVTKARIFQISRQALVNDDLGAFADLAAGWGLAAAETENQVLVDKLTENTGTGPTLGDGAVLFHTSHANVAGSGTAISDTTLSAARLALRSMKGLNGTTPISATPKYLLIPAALETIAEKYLSTLYPAQATNANPFGGTNKLEIVVDARLDTASAIRWYVFADPAVLPVIEYAYLAGAEGVQIETRAGFEVDGVEIKARLDFGCGGVDHRGAFMNPGA